jgi:iron complex transport system ATP-binding protein
MFRFDNLVVGYATQAIHTNPLQVTFDNQGEFVTLLGRNGCGKTTLLRTLMQSLPTLKGEIYLGGNEISKLSAKSLAQQISIVTTEQLNVPFFSVYDIIAMGRYPYIGFLGRLKKKDKVIIDNILQNLELNHLKNKYLVDCSDGEKQLVLIARALAQDTPIILLDEATAHLDFINRVKLFHLLRRLAEEQQKLVILATHELEIALRFAHKAILFHQQHIYIAPPNTFVENNQIKKVFATEGLNYELKLD